MQDCLFYLFAALTLLCGVLVIANPFTRNPVTSAMFLVLTIVSMAGLFVLLHAFFLAAVQILVYAGAVMVLFLFVIMLLDLKEEERRKIKAGAGVLGVAAAGVHRSDHDRRHPAIQRGRRPQAGQRGRFHPGFGQDSSPITRCPLN
jgi:NADH:ubiquinone oxidoreductase subunit 6 (subunit J)